MGMRQSTLHTCAHIISIRNEQSFLLCALLVGFNEEKDMLQKVLISLGIFAFGYYVGKEAKLRGDKKNQELEQGSDIYTSASTQHTEDRAEQAKTEH